MAPELAYISSRRDKKWLFAYTRNYTKLLRSGDPLAYCIYQSYDRMAMPVFPVMTDQALNELYSFIEYESNRRKLPMPGDRVKKCMDSCIAYSKNKKMQKPVSCDCNCGVSRNH